MVQAGQDGGLRLELVQALGAEEPYSNQVPVTKAKASHAASEARTRQGPGGVALNGARRCMGLSGAWVRMERGNRSKGSVAVLHPYHP